MVRFIFLNPTHGFVVFVSYSLLKRYDELETFSYANPLIRPISADGEQFLGPAGGDAEPLGFGVGEGDGAAGCASFILLSLQGFRLPWERY